MTSGRGSTHSERFEELRANGGPMDGIQAWVALPDEREETDPGFWHYPSQALPVFDGDGIAGRLIAGRLAGVESLVKVDSPQFYVHWQLRSEEHTSELQSLMRISYAVFCLKKKNKHNTTNHKSD